MNIAHLVGRITKSVPVFCLVLLAIVVQTAQALELEMPIVIGDVGYLAFGVAPFGYHVAEHRYDGHPGFDIEFIPGRKVRAAHGGTLRYTADIRDPSLKTVTIEFQDNGIYYQTFYTNIASLEPGIDSNVAVLTGQVFGVPASLVRDLGSAGSFTYAMTHFQLADNRVKYGLTNSSAISPEPFFSAKGKQILAEIWQHSQYHQMICEPFLSASRGVLANPVITRRWQRSTGSLDEIIEFSCDYTQNNPFTAYQYRLMDIAGNLKETGNVVVSPVPAGISTVDLQPEAGSLRRGVVFVKDGTMRLDYSTQGGGRPVNLLNASHYSTGDAVSCASSNDAICFKGNNSPYRANETLDIEIAFDWSKVNGGIAVADLWVVLVFPTGTPLFAHADSTWSSDAQPYRQALSSDVRTVPLLTVSIPPDLKTGDYTLYAALNRSGGGIENLAMTIVSNIAAGLLYIAP